MSGWVASNYLKVLEKGPRFPKEKGILPQTALGPRCHITSLLGLQPAAYPVDFRLASLQNSVTHSLK